MFSKLYHKLIMNYFTKHIILPTTDDSASRLEIFYIGKNYRRVVDYDPQTNKIEIDEMFHSTINGDRVDFPFLEGERIFDLLYVIIF